MSNLTKIPTLKELVSESTDSIKDNAFMVLCNQEPPQAWLVNHPMINGYKYLPIERVEYLLNRIFGSWWVEIRDSKIVANSILVTVRLYVTNPITGKEQWQDGIGASPIQTDKGQGAMDWNFAKSDGVQKSAPSAETYAIKDAAEKFGKLFGKDVSRKNQINYDTLLKQSWKPTLTIADFEMCKNAGMTLEEIRNDWKTTEQLENDYINYCK